VRTRGVGTTVDEAVRNAKITVLNQAGWTVDETDLSDVETAAQMNTRLIDTKMHADSGYQVIIDASVKTNYESTLLGAGVFILVAITSLVLIVTWGVVAAVGRQSEYMHSGPCVSMFIYACNIWTEWEMVK
jgi:hypothetical protein